MIKYSEEFFKKAFTADTMKKAYLTAAKWYASNVLSNAEFVNVQAQFIKSNENESPTITIHLFAVQDNEKDVMQQHCECCKEMHHSFFINEETNCNRCNALGFQKRLEQKINIKKEFYKETLRKHLKED